MFKPNPGVNGRTPYRKLERKLKSDFSAGAKPTFSVFDKAVGEFLCAKVYKVRRGWILYFFNSLVYISVFDGSMFDFTIKVIEC